MSKLILSKPVEDGFRMPGEFEPHSKCWMLWPSRPDNWRLNAGPAQEAFADVANTISRFEPVAVGVPRAQAAQAASLLSGRVEMVEMASDDAWMRDVGPTFVKNDHGAVRGIHWEFNAWGGLNGGIYTPWDRDRLVAQRVLEHESMDRYRADFVLEGGSIHVDGQGTLITTEECLLNPNRNPSLSKARIEDLLKEYLNVKRIIWLGKGVFMDETDGHVDNLCCFVRPGEVLLHWTEDVSDPQYEISKDAYLRLSHCTDARNRKLVIHKIIQPGPLFRTAEESLGVDPNPDAVPRDEGGRLAGSYVNFYMANRAVVMPLFDVPEDKQALETVKALFPERQVVGIFAREILLGGGNIHCITQQQPEL